MADWIVVAVIITFFGLCLLFVKALERL